MKTSQLKGIQPSVENYTKTVVQAGDQNGFTWDPLLKIAILQYLGFNVVQQIHTADVFSNCRIPGNGTAVVMQEQYTPNEDLIHWSASCEAATFLGRMSINPKKFKECNIDLKRIARYLRKPLADVVSELTVGDWYGMVLPESRVAHDVPMLLVQQSFRNLLGPIRKDMIRTLTGNAKTSLNGSLPNVTEALNIFDQMFNINQYAATNMWSAAMIAHWQKSAEYVGIKNSESVTTSVQQFSIDISAVHQSHPFFVLFWQHYSKAVAAYNQAVGGNGENLKPLEKNQLPFYVLLQGRESGRLERYELTYKPIKMLRIVRMSCLRKLQVQYPDIQDDAKLFAIHQITSMLSEIERTQGKVIALLGKAIPHVMELLMRAAMIVPHKGSAYLDKVFRFRDLFFEKIDTKISLHPLLRFDPNALDALQYVDGQMYLPEHLCSFFGIDPGQPIQCSKLGLTWREVVEKAKKQLKVVVNYSLSLKDDNKTAFETWLQKLIEFDIVDQTFAVEVLRLRSKIMAHNKKRARRYKTKTVDRAFEQEIQTYTIVKEMLQTMENGLLYLIAKRVRDLLSVIDLEYWNARPFSHWVLAFPGWLDSIKQTASVRIDPHCEL